MYKTVRKGDASLQYTILSQIDQFDGNGPTPPLPPPPPPSSVCCQMEVCKFAIATVAFVICIISVLAVGGAIYDVTMNSKIHNIPMALKLNDTHQQVSRIHYNENLPTNSNNSMKFNFKETVITEHTKSTVITTENSEISANYDIEKRTTLEDLSTLKNNVEVSSIDPLELNTVENLETVTITPIIFASSASSSTKNSQLSTLDVESISTTSSSTTSAVKKSKMPRVTLKLRENETIPQMYMKAGIASYKKGNITTSVLAHGLSLEGLIFKTPEGTIKPWNEKWSFVDSSPYARWKRYSDYREEIFAIFLTLMAVSVMIICLLTLAQLKTSRRRCHNVEESPLNGRQVEEQEHRSKLLDSEVIGIDDGNEIE